MFKEDVGNKISKLFRQCDDASFACGEYSVEEGDAEGYIRLLNFSKAADNEFLDYLEYLLDLEVPREDPSNNVGDL